MAYDVEFQPATKGACLHVPKGPERSPGILLLHGSEGGFAGWSSWLALALAMKGFVTFPYPYSKGGNGWHAGDIHEVDLDDTVTAIQWLREHPTVSGKVGLYGASRGAEHAILLTSLMARDALADLPDAVTAHSPSDTIAGAFIAGTWHPKERETWDPSKRAWRWRGSSEGPTPTTPIELERYAGPVFLSHGEDDKIVERRVHATTGKQIAVSWSRPRSSLLSERGAWFQVRKSKRRASTINCFFLQASDRLTASKQKRRLTIKRVATHRPLLV